MPKKSRDKNRRGFLKSIAAAPLVSAWQPAKAQQTEATPQVDALAEIVRFRYGNYLADGDMAEIKRGIERMQRSAEALAKVKTTNFDAPDFLFHPEGSLNS